MNTATQTALTSAEYTALQWIDMGKAKYTIVDGKEVEIVQYGAFEAGEYRVRVDGMQTRIVEGLENAKRAGAEMAA